MESLADSGAENELMPSITDAAFSGLRWETSRPIGHNYGKHRIVVKTAGCIGLGDASGNKQLLPRIEYPFLYDIFPNTAAHCAAETSVEICFVTKKRLLQYVKDEGLG